MIPDSKQCEESLILSLYDTESINSTNNDDLEIIGHQLSAVNNTRSSNSPRIEQYAEFRLSVINSVRNFDFRTKFEIAP